MKQIYTRVWETIDERNQIRMALVVTIVLSTMLLSLPTLLSHVLNCDTPPPLPLPSVLYTMDIWHFRVHCDIFWNSCLDELRAQLCSFTGWRGVQPALIHVASQWIVGSTDVQRGLTMAASFERILYAHGSPLMLAVPHPCQKAAPLAQEAFLARATGTNFGI
jgi:hypothetical protein